MKKETNKIKKLEEKKEEKKEQIVKKIEDKGEEKREFGELKNNKNDETIQANEIEDISVLVELLEKKCSENTQLEKYIIPIVALSDNYLVVEACVGLKTYGRVFYKNFFEDIENGKNLDEISDAIINNLVKSINDYIMAENNRPMIEIYAKSLFKFSLICLFINVICLLSGNQDLSKTLSYVFLMYYIFKSVKR